VINVKAHFNRYVKNYRLMCCHNWVNGGSRW